MTQPQSPIRNGLPLLKLFAPWAYWNTVIFGFGNLFLGLSLMFALDATKITASLVVVNDVFTYQFWGLIFILLGLSQLLLLHLNFWNHIRWSHRVGTVIKATWTITLIVRAITSPGTTLVAILWMIIMALQIVTFIFLPIPKVALKGGTNGKRI